MAKKKKLSKKKTKQNLLKARTRTQRQPEGK
jgi:hypothetical protein